MPSPQPQVPDEAKRLIGVAMEDWLIRMHGVISSHRPGTDDDGHEAAAVIADALPFLHADWEQEMRGRLQAEIDRIDQELAELEPIHNPPGRGIGFSKEAAYAAGLEIRRTCFEQARDAALTNREETPNG